jgi:hypothetical protein
MRALRRKKAERMANPRADQWMNAFDRWCSKMANRTQVITAEPAMSPSVEEKAYPTAVVSRKRRARKTNYRDRGQESGQSGTRTARSAKGAKSTDHLGSDAGVVVDLPSEGLESREDDEDERPGVVEGEGQVDKDCEADKKQR